MKRLIISLLAALIIGACTAPPKDIPQWNVEPSEDSPSGEPSVSPSDEPPGPSSEDPSDDSSEDASIDPESARDKIPEYTDMVLIYGYSHHRSPYLWTEEYLRDYVVYTDKIGELHWLFDAFLCLEFMDAGGSEGNKTFITGYTYNGSYLESANKEDWEKMLDYYFQTDSGVGVIDSAIEKVKKVLGEPPHKRQVVIGIPEPIPYRWNNYGTNQTGGTTYWGELDGKPLDFSKTADRMKALQWYIDTAREKFYAKNYQNVELGGFYITAERSTYITDILKPLGDYVSSKYYSFNWIPYYKADGYNNWKNYGFTQAYMQPNYFFNDSIGYERLTDACQTVLKYGMGLEIEFDGKALKSEGWGYRLRDYMKCTQEYGVWEECNLVYYQGSWALRWLGHSGEAEDNVLYHDFCKFVIDRPIRDSH